MTPPSCLSTAACHILHTHNAHEKVRLTFQYAQSWQKGEILEIGDETPPSDPSRPQRPELLAPTTMPRRRLGSEMGRIALIHAIAHIELNAIDLAWDIIARFTYENLPKEFYDDWVKVAQDEARHFQMLETRLADFHKSYGDLPAHNGLWDTAAKTHDDLMARLALVPLLLEPRGLDTTPATVAKLRTLGDDKTADVMDRIGFEEIAHVRAGIRWFTYMAEKRRIDTVTSYHKYVRTHFKGGLKAPFNIEARDLAGMTQDFYQPLTNTQAPA